MSFSRGKEGGQSHTRNENGDFATLRQVRYAHHKNIPGYRYVHPTEHVVVLFHSVYFILLACARHLSRCYSSVRFFGRIHMYV